MQAREQVRRSSLVILGSVAAGSLLVMLLFVGILWRDVNRSNRYKRQLEAAIATTKPCWRPVRS